MQEALTFREKKLPSDTISISGPASAPTAGTRTTASSSGTTEHFPTLQNQSTSCTAKHFKVALHLVLEDERLTGTVAESCTAPPLPTGRTPDHAPDRQVIRNRMYFETLQIYLPNKRVFALHRNAYAGMQRYATFLWSGAIADLIVVEGSPLENISLLAEPQRNILLVIKQGVIYRRCGVQRAGVALQPLQSWIHRLAFERQNSEDALVSTPQWFFLDKPLQRFDTERELTSS